MFSRSCFSSAQWQLPQSKQQCRQWLAEHSGERCPFPVSQTLTVCLYILTSA
jgi:hypothetical protein